MSSNLYFMAVGGESTSKDVVFTKAVNRAKEAVTSNECALVCVMTVTDGQRVKQEAMEGENALTDNQVLLVHSGVEMTKKFFSRVAEFKSGSGSTKLLVCTQPMNGIDCERLLTVEVLGSYDIVGCYQALSRAARKNGQQGSATFYYWKGLGPDVRRMEESRGRNQFSTPTVLANCPLFKFVSYQAAFDPTICSKAGNESLYSGKCLRGHLSGARGEGGRSTCADEGERAALGGGSFLLCSACDPNGERKLDVRGEIVEIVEIVEKGVLEEGSCLSMIDAGGEVEGEVEMSSISFAQGAGGGAYSTSAAVQNLGTTTSKPVNPYMAQVVSEKPKGNPYSKDNNSNSNSNSNSNKRSHSEMLSPQQHEATSAAATANDSSAISATRGAVSDVRYFTDSKNSSSWVCGDLGENNTRGCGNDNFNSRFLCWKCKRGKPGERAKRASLLEDSASDEARKMQI